MAAASNQSAPEILELIGNATARQFEVAYTSRSLTFEAEDAFVALFGDSNTSFWLDSSLLVPGVSRWSFMGAMSGPADHLCRFDNAKHALQIVWPDGRQSKLINQTIFEYLEVSAPSTASFH